MGFDIQRLAELLKLAEEYNRSQRTGNNPVNSETKSLAQLFTTCFLFQVKRFDIVTNL